MQKGDKVYGVLGMIMPWITLILLVAVPTYYCESFLIRTICVVAAILHGAVTLKLARRVRKEENRKSE